MDFFAVPIDEIRRFAPHLAEGRGGGRPMVLLTYRGCLKATKTLTDDRAWAVQGEMVDRYFAFEEMTKALAIVPARQAGRS